MNAFERAANSPRSVVLIVDPDDTARARTISHLQDLYYVVDAPTLQEAYARLTDKEERAVRFVVLELNMPDGDGLWLIRHLTTEANFPSGTRPIIVCLTTRKSVQDKVDALHAGASDYVVKPATNISLTLRLQLLERYERLLRDQWTV